MMRNNIILVFLLFAFTVNAQTDEIITIQILPLNSVNVVDLHQEGDNNQMVAIQQLNDNLLVSKQKGDNNNGYVTQAGAHESIVLQIGNTNSVNLYSTNTKETVFQFGDDNQIESHITSNSFLAVGLTQFGSHNKLDIVLENFELPFVNVTQTGGATAVIRHSDFNFPMK